MSTESNQCCDELRELVGELALGDEAWLSDDERQLAQAHVAECGACRAYMADVAAIGGALRSVAAKPEIEVPERILLETRLHILAAVRAKAAEFRRQRLEAAWRRRARLWWSVCAAAAVLVLGLGLWLWLSRSEPAEPARSLALHPLPEPTTSTPQPSASRSDGHVTSDEVTQVVQRPEGSPATARRLQPTLAERVVEAADVPKVLALLKKEYERAKEAPKESEDLLEQILIHAEALAAKSTDSEHEPEALRLIYHCHLQLADRKAAQQAFLAYADRLGAQAKARAQTQGVTENDAASREAVAAANAIHRETRRLMIGHDRVLGRSLCDVLVTRYPGTEFALDAQVLIGEHHLKLREPRRAADVFLAVIRAAPDGRGAARARIALASALFKAGKPDEAVEAWMDYVVAATSDDQRACGYSNAGVLLTVRGPHYYPQAMTMYQTILEKYPQTHYARLARVRLGKLQKQIEAEVLGMEPPS